MNNGRLFEAVRVGYAISRTTDAGIFFNGHYLKNFGACLIMLAELWRPDGADDDDDERWGGKAKWRRSRLQARKYQWSRLVASDGGAQSHVHTLREAAPELNPGDLVRWAAGGRVCADTVLCMYNHVAIRRSCWRVEGPGCRGPRSTGTGKLRNWISDGGL